MDGQRFELVTHLMLQMPASPPEAWFVKCLQLFPNLEHLGCRHNRWDLYKSADECVLAPDIVASAILRLAKKLKSLTLVFFRWDEEAVSEWEAAKVQLEGESVHCRFWLGWGCQSEGERREILLESSLPKWKHVYPEHWLEELC